jgi:hypothetical protein
LAGLPVETVWNAAVAVQSAYLSGDVSRYHVVNDFLQLLDQPQQQQQHPSNATTTAAALDYWTNLLPRLHILLTDVQVSPLRRDQSLANTWPPPLRWLSLWSYQWRIVPRAQQANTLFELKSLLSQTMYIPWITGPPLSLSSIHTDKATFTNTMVHKHRGATNATTASVQHASKSNHRLEASSLLRSSTMVLDGGFARAWHAPCTTTVAIPLTLTTLLQAFYPGLSADTAMELYRRGRHDAEKSTTTTSKLPRQTSTRTLVARNDAVSAKTTARRREILPASWLNTSLTPPWTAAAKPTTATCEGKTWNCSRHVWGEVSSRNDSTAVHHPPHQQLDLPVSTNGVWETRPSFA